jgi:hypothetical protein
VLVLEAAKVAVVKIVDAVLTIARMANIENAHVFAFIVGLH